MFLLVARSKVCLFIVCPARSTSQVERVAYIIDEPRLPTKCSGRQGPQRGRGLKRCGARHDFRQRRCDACIRPSRRADRHVGCRARRAGSACEGRAGAVLLRTLRLHSVSKRSLTSVSAAQGRSCDAGGGLSILVGAFDGITGLGWRTAAPIIVRRLAAPAMRSFPARRPPARRKAVVQSAPCEGESPLWRQDRSRD